jgi:ESF2/ABP1 family protein
MVRAAYEASTQQSLLRQHLSQSKRDQASYLNQVEKARVMEKRTEKKRQRDERSVERGEVRESVAKEEKKRAFRQRKAVERGAEGGALDSLLGNLF